MKKLITLILTGAILLGILGGCSKVNTNKEKLEDHKWIIEYVEGGESANEMMNMLTSLLSEVLQGMSFEIINDDTLVMGVMTYEYEFIEEKLHIYNQTENFMFDILWQEDGEVVLNSDMYKLTLNKSL
ncbi:hypothetical protein ABFP60_08390 [Clostridioides difficile]